MTPSLSPFEIVLKTHYFWASFLGHEKDFKAIFRKTHPNSDQIGYFQAIEYFQKRKSFSKQFHALVISHDFFHANCRGLKALAFIEKRLFRPNFFRHIYDFEIEIHFQFRTSYIGDEKFLLCTFVVLINYKIAFQCRSQDCTLQVDSHLILPWSD